jgi:hypothetical protein
MVSGRILQHGAKIAIYICDLERSTPSGRIAATKRVLDLLDAGQTPGAIMAAQD